LAGCLLILLRSYLKNVFWFPAKSVRDLRQDPVFAL
jgi:hypothetical protein